MKSFWHLPATVDEAWNKISVGLGAAWFPILLYFYMRLTGVQREIRVILLIVSLILLGIIIPGLSYLVHEWKSKSFSALKPENMEDLAIVGFLIVVYLITFWKFGVLQF